MIALAQSLTPISQELKVGPHTFQVFNLTGYEVTAPTISETEKGEYPASTGFSLRSAVNLNVWYQQEIEKVKDGLRLKGFSTEANHPKLKERESELTTHPKQAVNLLLRVAEDRLFASKLSLLIGTQQDPRKILFVFNSDEKTSPDALTTELLKYKLFHNHNGEAWINCIAPHQQYYFSICTKSSANGVPAFQLSIPRQLSSPKPRAV